MPYGLFRNEFALLFSPFFPTKQRNVLHVLRWWQLYLTHWLMKVSSSTFFFFFLFVFVLNWVLQFRVDAGVNCQSNLPSGERGKEKKKKKLCVTCLIKKKKNTKFFNNFFFFYLGNYFWDSRNSDGERVLCLTYIPFIIIIIIITRWKLEEEEEEVVVI